MKAGTSRPLRFPTLLLAVCIAGLALVTTSIHAQTGDTATGNEPLEDAVTLNFQDADILALINTVSQITGRNFIVDPRVKGKVTLISGGKLRADQIYEVFLSVLEVQNFSAVPSGDVIKIVPNNIVKQTPTRTEFGVGGAPTDEQITQVYQLKNGSVATLVPILRPLLPPTSHFAAHAPTNTLVFTDTAANIERILKIIDQVDKPDRRSDVHVVYLKNAKASSLAQVLTQLSASLQQSAGEGGALPPQITVQADDSINALVIQAPESEFQLLQAVIDQLDIPKPQPEGDIHVVYLKYAKATELVEILNSVNETEQQTTEEGAPNTTVKVSVQADEATNSLVIRAGEEDYAVITTVLEQLDVEREQVFVESIIAEVATDRATDLGITWRGIDNNATSEGEFDSSTNFGDTEGGLRVGFVSYNQIISVANGGVLLPDLSFVLSALRTDRNANILSTPNILTLDNEEAEIVVGQEVPFVTGQFVSDASGGGVVVDPGDGTGGGTATGVVNPFQTIERKDVGLTLRITPQINAGEAIRLEIEQEISSVSPTTVQGASDLITDRRSISTTVQVADGQIIVLGGLVRDDFKDTISQVPFLGKLPLIGALFRKKSKSAVKTNLMVFLRPKIVRSPEDLLGVTEEKYEEIRIKEAESLPDTRMLIEEARDPPQLPPWEGRR